MPLPPDIDPFGLSYEPEMFGDDAPPWPPPTWQEQEQEQVPVPVPLADPESPLPIERQNMLWQGTADEQPSPPVLQTMGLSYAADAPPRQGGPSDRLLLGGSDPAPLTDDLAGAPGPFAQQPAAPAPMPWETQPGAIAPSFPSAAPQQPGVRDIPGLSFYELREQAAPQTPSYLAPGDPNAPLPSMREEQVVDPFAGMTDEQGMAAARRLDPIKLQELEDQRAYIQQKKALADQARLEDENLARIEANRKMREDAAVKAQADTDKIIADAQALAEKGIDRKGWFSKLDTVGKIGAVVGALTGGLMSKAGGPNYGIEFIDKLVNADIEEQKYEIGLKQDALKTRQGAVAQAYQRSGDMYMAAETARLATYNALINKMKTEQQNFDPRGTMFLNHAKTIQQMQARAASAEQKIRQQNFENNLKKGELELKQKEFALKQAKAAGAGKPAKQPPSYYQTQGLPPPPIPMTPKEYEDWQKNKERAADIAKKDLATSPSERARELGVPGIVDDKGEQVLFRDAKTAGEIADVKGKVQTATRLVDQMIAAREKYGWSSNLFKSPEWRQIQSDYTNAQLVAKDIYGLGVITGPDLGLIEKAMGTSDPTEVRDPIPGLKASRANMINRVNDAIGAQAAVGEGRKLQRWEPPKLALPEAKATEKDQLLVRDRKETLDDVVRREREQIESERGYPLDMSDPNDAALFRGAYQSAKRKYDPSTTVDQRAQIDTLAAAVRGGDAKALEELQSHASSSDSPGIRALAKRVIAEIEAAKAPAPRGPTSAPVAVPDAFRLGGQ